MKIGHTAATVVTVHALIHSLDGSLASVVSCFTFCSGYLLWGYYVTLSEEYAFEWTIPQCVLTLRLIAVAFDAYDGSGERIRLRNSSSSSSASSASSSGSGNHVARTPPASGASSSSSSVASSSATAGNPEALVQLPSLLELAAHAYFPAAFLVGPQYGLRVYLDFVSQERSFLGRSLRAGVERLLLGILYMTAFQIGSLLCPHAYLVTSEFRVRKVADAAGHQFMCVRLSVRSSSFCSLASWALFFLNSLPLPLTAAADCFPEGT